MTEKESSGNGVERRSPVTKAIQMLAWMAESDEQSWGIRQAARGLDVPPSTAHRTFAMLESAGAVVSDEGGRYRFSLDLIEEKTGTRPHTLGVLSSEYHLCRSGLMAKKLGIDFVGVPAKTSKLTQLINHAMREVAGVWHFYLFGR